MLKKLLIYILIGIGLTFMPLCYVNNIILGDSKVIKMKGNTKSILNFNKNETVLPEGAKYVAATFDGNYVTYVDSDKLYIKDIKTDNVYDVVEDDVPIIYSLPLSDRNIVMYITYDDENLAIKTYDIDKRESTEHKAFKASKIEEICDVRYSSYTNMIYINAKTKNFGISKNNIYRVDIMKNVSVYAKGKKIEDIQLLNNKDALIYEDIDNKVHIKSKIFKYEDNKRFKLLGVDEEDNIYLLSLDKEGTVFVVKDGNVVNERHIEDLSYESVFNRDNKVFLVYKDYVYDVVNDRTIKIKPDSTLVDIKDNHVVYKCNDNKIVVDKI
ncbi:hypothetical protein SAMN05443428_103123 [Caloramator quimbayensis]|uniref:TolB protein n=1 Tax=Caloramator quimbayensis TaxID=1147123 RepID=A0A1T4WQY4_9CLOT|nr:hypothetical protein [Caloramator quimbayensis]SKA79770.1 hypothetical protein SAMN05443428_103123 [Caloramator quimbayensis]